jgi:hypothetical protein
LVFAVGHAVAVGVHAAGIDARIRRVVGARVGAVGNVVGVGVGGIGIARAVVLAVADAVVVGIGCARIVAQARGAACGPAPRCRAA